MTRLLGLLLTLVLVPLALVAPSSASAAGPDSWRGPYTGGPTTSLRVVATPRVVKGTRAVIRARVQMNGNALPVGRIVLVVKRRVGGFTWRRTVAYNGRTVSARTPRLTKRGKYTVTARFDPRAGSVWRPASNVDTFYVVRRR